MWSGLRDGNFDGEIVLVGSEPELPYERPHLSKKFLMGKVSRNGLGLRPEEQYREFGITFMLGERVVDIGHDAHVAVLESGKTVAWDRLCIATGSAARRLPEIADGLYLRELPDADSLRALIDRGSDLDVIGAGFIGCEVAAVAVEKGCRVRIHEALDQPLLRVLGPELGAYLAGVHRAHGVDLRLGVTAPPVVNGPVLVAVGSAPRTELAERAGVASDRGIEVDKYGRTSMPDVFAAGDVARFFNPLFGARIRVEHFQTAQRQGYMVGVAMAGNTELPPDEVPWFWSDQYDLNLQYAGAGLPWDEIVMRGEFGRPPFSVFYLSEGRLIGVAGINNFHNVSRAQRVMAARVSVTKDQLADPDFDLRKLLP
ncbi:MAG TPA: FAD-dependent oxidoreductase [Candidatus Eisenbacteria bacterium]|nr:FAD-dependent oxidoreductase [Candidatus Eisenbacteria bacterium]